MSILARLVMLLVWLTLVLGMGLFFALAMSGDTEILNEIFLLPADIPAPPRWGLVLSLALVACTAASLGWAFLNMSRMLTPMPEGAFRYLAVCLKRSAAGFFGFWAGSVLIWQLVPRLLALNAPPDVTPDSDWIPLEIELILLAVAFVFLALSRSLMRAQEIEDDSNSIV